MKKLLAAMLGHLTLGGHIAHTQAFGPVQPKTAPPPPADREFGIQRENWTYYKQVTFEEPDVWSWHVDTRDYHVSLITKLKDLDQLPLWRMSKHPENYLFTAEEIRQHLHRYADQTEEGKYYLMLDHDAKFRTASWQLKYIRIYRTMQGLIVFDNFKLYQFSKHLLNQPVHISNR